MSKLRQWRTILSGSLAGTALATSASATPLVTGRSVDLHLDRLIIVLVLCIGLAMATALLLRRIIKSGRGAGALAPWLRNLSGAGVSVLECKRISIHADVCRFAYANREYLVVVSPGGTTVLKEDTAQSPPGP